MFRSVFKRERDGTVRVRLDRDEAAVLAQLGQQLRELLDEADPADPAVERLFPRAYLDPTEDRAEQEWQAMAGSDLLASRLDALDRLLEDVGVESAGQQGGVVRFHLDSEGEALWLGVLNDLRLALGSRLGVTDDGRERSAPDEQAATALAVYDWLTALQARLVDLALDGTPPRDGRPEGPAQAD